MRQQRAALAFVMVAGLIGGVAAPVALAGISSGACAFADSETPTECVISAPWTVGGGGAGANNFPTPLPGPFAFHKTLRLTGTGSIDTRPTGVANNEVTQGITITIDGASEGSGGLGGAFVMDAGASLINANDPGPNDPPNNSAGPISITATGGATLAAGSVIKDENTITGGAGGAITLAFGASSTFAGRISSQNNTDTTGQDGGDIRITVTGNLVMTPDAMITSRKIGNSGESGHIRMTVSGNMTMQGSLAGGATITSAHPSATNGTPGGNIRIDVGTGDEGVFTMENGTLVDSGGRGFAGNIWIKAGDQVNVNDGARVLAGQRSEQDTRGHGGRIYVTAGCEANILGILSSQGRDPGADLVHVEGCLVHVGPNGLIESTGDAHQPSTPASCDNIDDPATSRGGEPASEFNQPGEVLRDHPDNSSVCVEIWARHVVIDAGGEINANFALSGGIEGHGWIDIFAQTDITINGPAVGPFAVHSNGLLGNDTGGDVTVKAQNGFVSLSGLALQANATADGGKGGHVIVQGGGDVLLDAATIEARGSLGGSAPAGGTIEGRSFNGTLTGTAPGALDASGDGGARPGLITLQSCLGTNYTGASTPAAQILADACGGTPTFPAYVIFNPGGRWDRCGASSISGTKFNDQNNNHAWDPGEPGLDGWTINLYDSNNVLIDSAVTAGGGLFSFSVAGGQSYVLCEVLQPNWTQTFPVAGAGVVACAGVGEAALGYSVDLNVDGSCCGGQQVTRNFGNFEAPRVTCKEDPNRAALLTRTVDTSKPLGGGGVAGNPQNFWTLQAAYDVAKTSLQSEVIGMFSKTTENVVLNGSKSLTITQCESAQLTAANGSLPVWKITSTGKLLIIGPDSVGGTLGWELVTGGHTLKSIRSNGASVAGVRVLSNGNDVSFNNIASSGIGLDILGSSNKFKSGTIGPNAGGGVHIGAGKTGNTVSGATIQDNGNYGVWVEGSTNTIQSNKLYRNAVGIKVTGASNKILSNQVETSTGDGVYVSGSSNLIQDNKISKNGGDGIEIAGGSNNNLKSNASNNSGENAGFEFARAVAVINGGSNKADGTSVPSTSKCSAFFTGAAATCE